MPLEKVLFSPSSNNAEQKLNNITVARIILDAMEIQEDVLMTYIDRYSTDLLQKRRQLQLPTVRTTVAKEAACAWIKHEYSRGAFVKEGKPPISKFVNWIPNPNADVVKTGGAILLKFEHPGWLSAALANTIAKVLVETKFMDPITKSPVYRVQMIKTTGSARTVGRAAHATDVPTEDFYDFTAEVWGEGRFNLFLDPNTTTIEHVLTFYSLIRSIFFIVIFFIVIG